MSQVIDILGFTHDSWADAPAVSLAEYDGGPVLLLSPDDNPADAAKHFTTLELIVLSFASSFDGRGFSQAAALRQMGYHGALRARGHVLVDQFRAALRVGFTDIEITDEQAARNPESQWRAVSHPPSYQSRLRSV